MELGYNIDHKFDLKGMRKGDVFMGCTKCWFQLPPRTVCKAMCPNCGTRLQMLSVRKDHK